jgi:hypothetical protein
MGRENAAHSLNSRIKSVIYVENANSNNCVPARRKNFSFMSDDAQNSADTTHAAGGPATTMGAATAALHMSAFGGKADMTFCGANVCF